MKIKKIEMLHANAGWRPWSFVKITTNGNIVGWSECSDSHGSPRGMEGVVKDLSPLLIDKNPNNIEILKDQMHARTRQSPGSVVQKAIAGIENALWDIKGKALGVPVYELLGGPIRDTIPLYWSHCGTSRVRASDLINKPAIKTYEDLKLFGKEISNSGYKTIKTNIAILEKDPYIYMPGFYKSPGGPERNLNQNILYHIEKWISSFRDSVGEDIDIALDLNFNFKPEGLIRIGKILERYHLSWIEMDSYDPIALKEVKQNVRIPIASCENLYGANQYKPFYENRSMDIPIIDVLWNGLSESRTIASIADLHQMNICTHNFNGHLSTFISAHFCALVPNLLMSEIDVDDVPWREDLFTSAPDIQDGNLVIPKLAGWGVDVNEEIIDLHPWPN